ncbi:MAG: hypothetical protein JWN29_3908 [Acidimicrobiales bacterium]|nr:hypothetical protein [Acidimicrobiales bacterium]
MAGAPSDDVPAILEHGTTDVQVGVVSMSARSPDGQDAAYVEWHLLDHLPEQHRIGGVRGGVRWVSTPACRAARAASERRFDAVDHVVQYLFAEPVDESLAAFFGLGGALRGAGRMPLRLPGVELGGYRLAATVAARRVLAGADVLPWRPARGAYLLVEEGGQVPAELVEVPGVAGLWSWEGSATVHVDLAPTDGLRLTVCYLDDDPVATACRLAPVLSDRWSAGVVPLLAAPFEPVVPWQWERSLPG